MESTSANIMMNRMYKADTDTWKSHLTSVASYILIVHHHHHHHHHTIRVRVFFAVTDGGSTLSPI